jgi:hypothetical protein
VSPRATRFEFRPPEVFQGHPKFTAHLYDSRAITVDWRGGDRWAISAGSGGSPQEVWCERDGEWEYEPIPSSRDDDFLARCRYSLDDALLIGARLAAPTPREESTE